MNSPDIKEFKWLISHTHTLYRCWYVFVWPSVGYLSVSMAINRRLMWPYFLIFSSCSIFALSYCFNTSISCLVIIWQFLKLSLYLSKPITTNHSSAVSCQSKNTMTLKDCVYLVRTIYSKRTSNCLVMNWLTGTLGSNSNIGSCLISLIMACLWARLVTPTTFSNSYSDIPAIRVVSS